MVTLDKYNGEHFINADSAKKDHSSTLRTFKSNSKQYKTSARTEMLAMPKDEYKGKHLFEHSDFRGLFIADNQKALGKIAEESAATINYESQNMLNSINSIREMKFKQSTKEDFYKSNTFLNPKLTASYRHRNRNINT